MVRKRYILFGGQRYYPQGAREDECGRYDTLEEVHAVLERFDTGPGRYDAEHEWCELLDLDTGKWTSWRWEQAGGVGPWVYREQT